MSNAERRQQIRGRIEDQRAALRRLAATKNTAFAQGDHTTAFDTHRVYLDVKGTVNNLFRQLFELHRKK